MLKRLALLTAILLLGALPATAQKACKQGNDLNVLLAQIQAPEPTPPVIMLASTSGAAGEKATCTVTEDCDALPDISCMGTVCSAISRNCAIGFCERGQVTCNGVTTQCSQICPFNCTNFECKQGCQQPGCVAVCVDRCNCECETICQ